MKIYTIIGGVNGVGKSSLTGVLSAKTTDLGIIIDVDKITAELGGDKIKGGKASIEKINHCLDMGVSFTQETTLSGHRTERTMRRAIEDGYFIRLYYVGVNDLSESLSRIENRVRKGGHDIPKDDVRHRYENRFADLEKILPLCNEAEFFDNENGFVEVAEYKNGDLILKGDYRPLWITELKNYLDNNILLTSTKCYKTPLA